MHVIGFRVGWLAVGVEPLDDRPTIPVDLPAALTIADWAAGIDPALAAIGQARR